MLNDTEEGLFTYRENMNQTTQNLTKAEQKAAVLFEEMEKRGLMKAGKTEKELNNEVYQLAFELYGIKKYWHKRIVRAGENTLRPYYENPENLTIQEDDIIFLDFGPIFDEWEADFGRTYVIGNDPLKHQLKNDIEVAWHECKTFYQAQKEMTGAQLYEHAISTARKYGWEFGGEIAGHIIGHFPHERLEKEDKTNYIHQDNHKSMSSPDLQGNKREWILEIHFVDRKKQIGGFFEQLLT